MKFKKILSAAAAVILGFSVIAGCSDSDSKSDAKKDISSITAADVFSDLKVGWNLGNSLDSVGSGLSSETSWGNPIVTKELIDAVKSAGFNTVRIPVTWMGHFSEGPEYKIDEEWMNRVEEVVNYVIDNGMYAIINIHHDGNDTSSSWLTPEPTDEAEMISKFTVLWTQIADRFKDYDEKLLFAGMNELHKGYDKPADAYLQLTNKLNQSFVDTVRAGGGNNPQRILIVQAYNTNAEYAISGLQIPDDTAENKIMAEFHFYDPWSFAGEGRNSWGKGGPTNDRWGQEEWVDDIFGRLKTTFSDNGIPVIMGEYGAVNNKAGYSDTRRYYVEYVTKAARQNGILPIWWDNGFDGIDGGEAFALFDRQNGNVVLHQDLIDAIMRGVNEEDYEIALPVYPS